MNYKSLFIQSKKDVKSQESINATIFDKAGFTYQVSSGVYALLPLGLMVVRKIEEVIREEMNKVGGVEILMPTISPKNLWQQTGRLDDKNMKEIIYMDDEKSVVFSPTHEETVTDIATKYIKSYADLPMAFYQIQTKFRRELRAKSGLLRGREFMMKDLYSFHSSTEDLVKFYEKVAEAYLTIFKRLGLEAYRVKALGGGFTKEFSDEFQVLANDGEDEILYDEKTKRGFNKEVEDSISDKEKKELKRGRAIEVGNIFKLGTKYSEALGLEFTTKNDDKKPVIMASYGIGITRLLGTIAEIFNDKDGLVLPKAVAPFMVYAIDLSTDNKGKKIFEELEEAGVKVLVDDRDVRAGDKFVEADLLGMPYRLIISDKTLEKDEVEIKDRKTGKIELISAKVDKIAAYLLG